MKIQNLGFYLILTVFLQLFFCCSRQAYWTNLQPGCPYFSKDGRSAGFMAPGEKLYRLVKEENWKSFSLKGSSERFFLKETFLLKEAKAVVLLQEKLVPAFNPEQKTQYLLERRQIGALHQEGEEPLLFAFYLPELDGIFFTLAENLEYSWKDKDLKAALLYQQAIEQNGAEKAIQGLKKIIKLYPGNEFQPDCEKAIEYLQKSD